MAREASSWTKHRKNAAEILIVVLDASMRASEQAVWAYNPHRFLSQKREISNHTVVLIGQEIEAVWQEIRSSLRRLDWTFSPWAIGPLVLGLAAAQSGGVLRVRTLLCVNVVILAALATGALTRLTANQKKTALALVALSLLLQALPEILRPTKLSYYEFSWRANLVLWGWVFIFSLVISSIRPSPPGAGQRNRRNLILLLCLAFVALVCAHFAIRNRYAAIPDEIAYLLQAKSLSSPGFTRPLDLGLSPFFLFPNSYVLHGRLNGMYPPGWPLVLSLFDHLGLRWFAPPTLALMVVLLTYVLGKQLRSHAAGLLAAALLATSYWLVYLGSVYMANILTMLLGVASASILLVAEAKTISRFGLWLLAGFFLGVAFLARPVTGAMLGLSLWGWVFVRHRVQGLELARMAIALALGALPAVLFLLYYDKVSNGDVFLLGYRAALGSLQGLGFGWRGGIAITQQGEPFAYAGEFTPVVAVVNFLSMARAASIEFTPFFVLAPLLFLASRYKLPVPWKSVAVFLLLPAVHFFYFYPDTRYLVELLPFLMVGIAIVIMDLSQADRPVARLLVCFLIAGNLLLGGFGLARDCKAFHQNHLPYFNRVAELHRQYGPLLVFLRSKRGPGELPWLTSGSGLITEPLFTSMWWFNVDPTSGVIVARDVGSRDSELMQRWPHHFVIRLSDDWPARVEEHDSRTMDPPP